MIIGVLRRNLWNEKPPGKSRHRQEVLSIADDVDIEMVVCWVDVDGFGSMVSLGSVIRLYRLFLCRGF